MKDLRNLTRILISLAASAGLTACDPGDDASPDGGGAPPDAPCTTWYPDRDGDGFGDHTSQGEINCEQFTGTVDNKLDCDDATRFRRPGHPEVCDGIDNDCNGVAEAACPSECDVVDVAGGSIYLVCNIGANFDTARVVCRNQGMDLVHINSQEENELLRHELTTTFQHWIGATDSGGAGSEGAWRWVDNGENFWNGGPANATPAGHPVPGVFSNWAAGYPDGGDAIDCAALQESLGLWMDTPCDAIKPFLCERTPDPT